jgi:hypothetical protein
MVYDLDITADKCDVIGRKLSAAERTRVADIAIGVKALRSAMQGGVPGKDSAASADDSAARGGVRGGCDASASAWAAA